MNRTPIIERFLSAFLVFVSVFAFTLNTFAIANRTTYQAKIIKPNGQPLESASVNFRFTVLDNAASCVLYIENYTAVNMLDGGGLVSFSLGSGTRSFPVSGSANSFAQAFDNSTPMFNCQTVGTYNPAPDDNRKVVMQFNDGNGWQTLPAMAINAVPYAMYAGKSQNSLTLNNKADSAFVEYSTLAGLSCAADQAIKFNGVSFSCITVGGSGTAVTSGSVIAALGYTPANGSSFTSVSSSLLTVSSTVFSVSSTVTSLQSSFSSFQATTAASFAALSGSGIGSFNGSSSATQSLGNSLTGTTPTFSTVNGVHTLNIPYASVGTTTAGLISNVEHSLFSTVVSKITSSAASIAQVLGYTPADQTTVTTLSSTVGSVSATATSAFNTANSVSSAVNALSSTVSGKITSSAVALEQVLGYTPAASGTSQWTNYNASSIGYTKGYVGVGTTSPTAQFSVSGTANISGSMALGNANLIDYMSLNINQSFVDKAGYGVFAVTDSTRTSASTGNVTTALSGYVRIGASNTQNWNSTMGAVTGVWGQATIVSGAAGVINSAAGIAANFTHNAANATVTNAFGVLVNPMLTSNGAVITNATGIGVAPVTVALNNTQILLGQSNIPTGNFGIYNASSSSNYFEGRLGLGVSSPVTKLEVSGGIRISMESATCAASYAGTLRYNSGNVEYCNGSAWTAFGAAGAGLATFNGSTSTTQTLAYGNSGTAPTFSTVNGVHTLNIPYASVGTTTAGLISNADYVNFNSKVSSQWTTSASAIYYNAGFVGIGTSSPDYPFVTQSAATGDTFVADFRQGDNLGVVIGSISGTSLIGARGTNQDLTIKTYGAGRVLIPTGNVGIGTSSPITRAHVYDSNPANTSLLTLESSHANYSGLVMKSAGTSQPVGMYAYNNDLSLWAGSNPRLTIAQSGHIGIGTITPQRRFHITSSTSMLADTYLMRLSGTDGLMGALPVLDIGFCSDSVTGGGISATCFNSQDTGGAGSAGQYVFKGENYYQDIFLINGKIGVGVSNPIQAMDVSGVIRAGNASSVAGSMILTGKYSSGNGALTVLGSEQSSGGPTLGYGVSPAPIANGGLGNFLSTTPVAIPRTAMAMSNSIRFYTGAAQTTAIGNSVSTTEVMRIENNGYVGIGTSAPVYSLDVRGPSYKLFSVAATNGDAAINLGGGPIPTKGSVIYSNAGHSGSYNGLWLASNVSSASPYTQANTGLSSWALDIGGTDVPNFGGQDSFRILRSPAAGASITELVRVTSNGSVGIGTIAPLVPLHVSGAKFSGSFPVNAFLTDTLPQAADIGGGIAFGGYGDGSSSTFAYGAIRGGKENSTSGSYLGYLSLMYRTQAALQEGIRMTSSGSVGIGTITPNAKLAVAEGTVASNNNVATFGTSETNWQGVYIQTIGSSGTLIQSTRYGMANNDLSLNYHGGNVGVGTLTPKVKLDVTGEVKVGNASTACSAAVEGSLRYNSVSKTMEFCNGTVWGSIGGSGSIDSTPDAVSFNSVTNADLLTTYTSNVVTLTNFEAALSVTCTSCTFSISGGTFKSTGAVAAGDTIAVRMVTSGTTGVYTSTLKIGATTATYSVTTWGTAGQYTLQGSAGTAGAFNSSPRENCVTAGYTGTTNISIYPSSITNTAIGSDRGGSCGYLTIDQRNPSYEVWGSASYCPGFHPDDSNNFYCFKQNF